LKTYFITIFHIIFIFFQQINIYCTISLNNPAQHEHPIVSITPDCCRITQAVRLFGAPLHMSSFLGTPVHMLVKYLLS